MPNSDGELDHDATLHLIITGLERALEQEPWQRLSRAERVVDLPALVTSLLSASESISRDRATWTEMMRCAWEHGRRRAQQGLDERVIFDEYYLLRCEAYSVFRERLETRKLGHSIGRLDAVITSAMMASLRGMHGLPHPAEPA